MARRIEDRIVHALQTEEAFEVKRVVMGDPYGFPHVHDSVELINGRRVYRLLGSIVAIYRPLEDAGAEMLAAFKSPDEVRFYEALPPGSISLGVIGGAFQTATTLSRIRAIASAFGVLSIYIRRGVWYWSDDAPYTGPRIFKVKEA